MTAIDLHSMMRIHSIRMDTFQSFQMSDEPVECQFSHAQRNPCLTRARTEDKDAVLFLRGCHLRRESDKVRVKAVEGERASERERERDLSLLILAVAGNQCGFSCPVSPDKYQRLFLLRLR